jgi:hypothetical protein
MGRKYTGTRFLSHRIPKGLTARQQAAWIKRHSKVEPQEQR